MKVMTEKIRRSPAPNSKQHDAAARAADAEEEIDSLEGILTHALETIVAVDWDELKNHKAFAGQPPAPPAKLDYPPEPQGNEAHFQPTFSISDRADPVIVEKKLAEAKARFEAAFAQWTKETESVRAENDRRQSEHAAATEKWNEEKLAFEAKQKAEHESIDQRKAAYLAGDYAAIADYCRQVLARSSYPDYFPKEFELQLSPETMTLIVDYLLPPPDQMPRIKNVKYVKSKDEIVEVPLPESQRRWMYDELLYQICLRTIHELFTADSINALAAIAFNGWVRVMDKSVGREIPRCVMSVCVGRDAFDNIDLGKVDVPACFEGLQGVGGPRFYRLTPITPLMQISR